MMKLTLYAMMLLLLTILTILSTCEGAREVFDPTISREEQEKRLKEGWKIKYYVEDNGEKIFYWDGSKFEKNPTGPRGKADPSISREEEKRRTDGGWIPQYHDMHDGEGSWFIVWGDPPNLENDLKRYYAEMIAIDEKRPRYDDVDWRDKRDKPNKPPTPKDPKKLVWPPRDEF